MNVRAIIGGLIVGGFVLVLSAESQTPETTQHSAVQPKVTENATVVSDTKQTEHRYSNKFGSHLEPILKEINASAKQRDTITKIVEEFKPQLEPLRKQYRDLREQFLRQMANGGSADELMNTQLEMSRVQTEISSNYLMMRLRVRKVLTEEQIPKFEEYRERQGWKSHHCSPALFGSS